MWELCEGILVGTILSYSAWRVIQQIFIHKRSICSAQDPSALGNSGSGCSSCAAPCDPPTEDDVSPSDSEQPSLVQFSYHKNSHP